MDRKEFIKRLLIGGAGLGLLPGFLSGKSTSSVKRVALPEGADHVRHGLFAPMDAASLAAGPEWLSHFRKDRFHSNGFALEASDMVHLTLGLGGEPLGITLKGKKAFVGHEKGNEQGVNLPQQGNRILLQTRRYEAWMLCGKGKLDFPSKAAPEAFFLPLQHQARFHGYKANPTQALWMRGNEVPEIYHQGAGRSLLILKFA